MLYVNWYLFRRALITMALKRLNIKHKRTRPYSPWQNGIVERSHRIDNERFYNKKRIKVNDINQKKKFMDCVTNV